MRTSLVHLAAVAALSSFIVPAAAQPQADLAATSTHQVDGQKLLAAAQSKLAWDLIEKLAAHGNGADVTVSPASLAAAFGALAPGADPAFAAAIAKVLGFGQDRVDASLETLLDLRTKLANAGNAFHSANRIVFTPTSAPNRIVQAGLQHLGIDFSIADLSKPEPVAEIDAWVKKETQGAIPEILGGPLEKASFVALNALHFKDRWKTPFDPQLTTPTPFKGVDGKTDNVAMMRLGSGKRLFRQEHNFVGVDLPFADERFSLVVVTTTDRPAAAKDFAKAADWLSGAGFVARSGDLALPRFSASSRQDLTSALDALGLGNARRSKTALQGIAPGATLSEVIQHAMIDVEEEGAEAAAATAIMATRSVESDDALHMVVDKPFIYALRDSVTGLVIMAGYVGHPPKGNAA
jgi:serpin B